MDSLDVGSETLDEDDFIGVRVISDDGMGSDGGL
jgi:hypothetical protein